MLQNPPTRVGNLSPRKASFVSLAAVLRCATVGKPDHVSATREPLKILNAECGFNHSPLKLDEYNLILTGILTPSQPKLASPNPELPNVTGEMLSEHFRKLGHDLSEFKIELTHKYQIPQN
jgi:hypothetical protein